MGFLRAINKSTGTVTRQAMHAGFNRPSSLQKPFFRRIWKDKRPVEMDMAQAGTDVSGKHLCQPRATSTGSHQAVHPTPHRDQPGGRADLRGGRTKARWSGSRANAQGAVQEDASSCEGTSKGSRLVGAAHLMPGPRDSPTLGAASPQA